MRDKQINLKKIKSINKKIPYTYIKQYDIYRFKDPIKPEIYESENVEIRSHRSINTALTNKFPRFTDE